MLDRRLVFWPLIAAATAAFWIAPAIGANVGLRETLFLAAVYIILASNLNLMIGYTGYVNFGNIVFFGVGGYVGVYLITVYEVPLVVAAIIAGLVVGLAALVFGLGILRLRGAYFALATIGINEAVRAFVSNFEPWGGATGLYMSQLAYQALGGPRAALWIVYDLLIGVMGLSLALSYGIKTSKFGLGLFAIREDEEAAAILGVRTPRYKAMVYSLSSILPAITGVLYFYKNAVIQPEQAFDLNLSIEAIVMVMLGGHGSVVGPALGAFLYEKLRGWLLVSPLFSNFHLVIAGLLLLGIVLFAPGGLTGWLLARFPRLRKVLQ